MIKKWSKEGAVAPLFDRLCDYNLGEDEYPPFQTLSVSELRLSVMQEISNLLNTRCPLSFEDYNQLDPNSLIYGIPDLFGFSDFSFFDGENKLQWSRVSEMMATAISIFEPRLQNVNVTIRNFNRQTQSLDTEITGTMVSGTVRESLMFPIIINNVPINQVGPEKK
jgi:type VI secretion system protein ImpF